MATPPGSPHSGAPGTPREKIQELNKRLEYYIVIQREKDAHNRTLVQENEELKSIIVSRETQITSLEVDLAEARAANQRQVEIIERLEKILAELKSKKDIPSPSQPRPVDEAKLRLQIENELRKVFGAQLKKLLAERGDQFNAEKNELVAKIKAEHERAIKELQNQLATTAGVVQSLHKQIEDLRKRLEELKSKPSPLLERIRELERANAELHQNVHALERRISELTGQLDRAQNVELDKLRDTTNLITDLEKKLLEKQRELAIQLDEYKKLFEINIALDTEIKAYRLLLENEEERLNYTVTAKRRKGAEARVVVAERAESRIRIFNEGDLSDMSAWTLRVNRPGITPFTFPNAFQLATDQYVDVVFGNDPAPDNGFAWRADIRPTDRVELFDVSGSLHATV